MIKASSNLLIHHSIKANLGVVCWGFSRIHVFLIAAPNLNVSIRAIFGLIIGMRNMIGVVSRDRMKFV